MVNKGNGLTAWGLTMMAFGTVIGGSFFLGSSIAIKAAGPGVIISYILGGALVYFILFALSEMTVADATPGSFRTFSERAFGPGVGFVVGWVYWTGLVLAMSSEAIAVSSFIRIWIPQAHLALLGSIVIILTTIANLLGAERVSRLENGLASVKLLAIIGFIIISLVLVSGFLPNKIPAGALGNQAFFSNGIPGIAGSMLIVMFAYAGFEIIGLAASESVNPHETVPRAIRYTVFGLISLYTISTILILAFIPTQNISTEVSPMVAALASAGMGWAAGGINIVLVTAIFSTMLASTFGLGRMIRSLAEEGHAPAWIKDKGDMPYKGILFSGSAMLAGLFLGFILPEQTYTFLVSSGGFSLLFSYVVILATHYRFRKANGCPPYGKCQLFGYPYVNFISLGGLVLIIASMSLIEGQGAGLIAGLLLLTFYAICYRISKQVKHVSLVRR